MDGIYLAVGSSCTVSGIIIGVALARRLGQLTWLGSCAPCLVWFKYIDPVSIASLGQLRLLRE